MADELDRLDALLTKQEQRVAQAIRDYLVIVNSDVIQELVADLLERGESEEAIALLNSYVNQIGDVFPSTWQEVGREAMTELAAIVPGIAVGISFDVTHPRAADLVRANRLLFIRNFSDQQRTSVRQALSRAMMEGQGPAETARAFRMAVGLAPVQEKAVANYRRLLENLHRDALARELRDRRFDDKVAEAIERQRPLTVRQIDVMVDRYRARYVMMRTENIARTEAHDAFSAARDEALNQMVEQTGIDRRRVIRIWNVTRDQRLRDWHATMSGQERKIGELFVDGLGNQLRRPGDRSAPAETTINCFPEGTLILPAGLQAVIRRHYCGELVELHIAGGINLAITPNHPVLTNRGWVLAGELLKSDYLIKDARVRHRLIGDPYKKHGYASSQHLWNLAAVGPIERPHGRTVDFHGERPEHDIEIVTAPRTLQLDWLSVAFELFGDLAFKHADTLEPDLLFERLAHLGGRAIPASSRLLGVARQLYSFLGGQSLHPQFVGLGNGPDRQFQVAEAVCYETAVSPKLPRNFLQRSAQIIKALNIGMQERPLFQPVGLRAIKRVHYDGPLYNFETSNGLIIGNGIVTHNCRCTLTFRIAEAA